MKALVLIVFRRKKWRADLETWKVSEEERAECCLILLSRLGNEAVSPQVTYVSIIIIIIKANEKKANASLQLR